MLVRNIGLLICFFAISACGASAVAKIGKAAAKTGKHTVKQVDPHLASRRTIRQLNEPIAIAQHQGTDVEITSFERFRRHHSQQVFLERMNIDPRQRPNIDLVYQEVEVEASKLDITIDKLLEFIDPPGLAGDIALEVAQADLDAEGYPEINPEQIAYLRAQIESLKPADYRVSKPSH